MLHKLSLGLTPLPAASTRLRQDQGYDADAVALFDRMDVRPDAARRALINALIVALKSAGIWQQLDFFYMLAAHDAQAARLNWVADDRLTPIGSPLFIPDRGYKGDGTGAYLESVFNQANLPKARTPGHNDASWLVGTRYPGEASRFIIGAASGVRFALLPAQSGTEMTFRNGQGTTSDTFGVPGQTGRFGSTRSGPATHHAYRNGQPIGSSATASTPSSGERILLLRGGANYSSAEVTHFAAGAGLTPQQQLAADTALAAYLEAVGAV